MLPQLPGLQPETSHPLPLQSNMLPVEQVRTRSLYPTPQVTEHAT